MPTAFNRGFEPQTSDLYYRNKSDIIIMKSITVLINLKRKYKNYPWLSPPLTSQILQDGVFEGLSPDARFVSFEFDNHKQQYTCSNTIRLVKKHLET